MSAKILFLFNHDAAHQVAHLGGIVRWMRNARPDLRIICATGVTSIRHCLERLLGEAANRIEWLDLALPPWLDRFAALPDKLAPVRRLMMLDHHARPLLDADLIVSAERTCLRLRRWDGQSEHGARFVHVPHGAGDRAVTFHADKAGFDRILVSGDKTARALVQRGGVSADAVRVVGYSKFDTVDGARRLHLFANDRPTFLYNPHFDPFLSSWYEEGPALLEWFASGEGRAFNLIFAPHVMLFRKKLHISPEYRRVRLRPGIPAAARNAPNILIDIDGPRLLDMSYTLSADAYIGDVSSQVYEFLLRPRPVFFLDRFSHDPRSREGGYPAWQTGDVVRSAAALADLLPSYKARLPRYEAAQRRIFAETMSRDPRRTASQRAGEAILEMLDP